MYDNNKNDPSNPLFNDSLGYLKEIRILDHVAHTAATNDNDYTDWLAVLQQLHILIDPRLKGTVFNIFEKDKPITEADIYKKIELKPGIEDVEIDEKKLLEYLRRKAIRTKGYEDIRAYHLWLSRLIDERGLGMKDQEEIGFDDITA